MDRRLGMRSRTGESLVNQATKTCAECRDTLVFSNRYPVLSGRTPGDGSGERGIRYKQAWICRNGRCDYRELVDDISAS
jgi:hypothetical protein